MLITLNARQIIAIIWECSDIAIKKWANESLVDGATSCTGKLQPLTYRELTADISGVLTFTLRLLEADNLAKLLRQCHCAPRAHQ